MTRPLPHHCADAVRALEAAADQQVGRLARPSIAGDVRSRVLSRLRGREPLGDVDAVAAELHLCARTLQRRLGAEGTSFSDVVEAARRDLAAELLDGGATLVAVARAVGFSDASALLRAYKRWTGKTPARRRPADGPRITAPARR
jgi:AraC-like DNA-binding protein